MTIDELLAGLERDIQDDAKKMGKWRQIHRITATAVTLALIVLPVSTAMKLLGEGAIQTYCLFGLTVVAAFDGMFKPAAYSARRRVDATEMTELLWQFRSAVVAAGIDPGRKLAVHDAYRKRFLDVYRQRGQYLVDYGLAQRENDKQRSDSTPSAGAPSTGAPISSATAPAGMRPSPLSSDKPSTNGDIALP
jgi:hypothetical protein